MATAKIPLRIKGQQIRRAALRVIVLFSETKRAHTHTRPKPSRDTALHWGSFFSCLFPPCLVSGWKDPIRDTGGVLPTGTFCTSLTEVTEETGGSSDALLLYSWHLSSSAICDATSPSPAAPRVGVMSRGLPWQLSRLVYAFTCSHIIHPHRSRTKCVCARAFIRRGVTIFWETLASTWLVCATLTHVHKDKLVTDNRTDLRTAWG